jgi:polyphosphate kinase 2 (PPK2 family)
MHSTPAELSLPSDQFEHPVISEKSVYEQRLKGLQKQMMLVQQAYYHQGQRAILCFEGWDAAGKGGAIRRLTERLDPRSIHVYPIGAPSAKEQGTHYLYRFMTRLPAAGHIAVFDRSWYGRVLVERVERFAEEQAWRRAYDEINQFEQTLTNDGVRIVKLFLHISPLEQIRRFRQRLETPLKHWKLTEEDIRNQSRWQDYEQAINDMFSRTSTEANPWKIILANRKWYCRVAVLEYIVGQLSRGIDLTIPEMEPGLRESAQRQLDELEERITFKP